MTPLRAVDQVVRASELKWGPVRLPLLVSEQTRNSFDRGWDKWAHAIREDDQMEQARLAPLMVRALEIMDREAEAAGCQTLSERDGDRRTA